MYEIQYVPVTIRTSTCSPGSGMVPNSMTVNRPANNPSLLTMLQIQVDVDGDRCTLHSDLSVSIDTRFPLGYQCASLDHKFCYNGRSLVILLHT